jgi:hypothetical protein
MKTFTAAAKAAIERGDAVVAGACFIGTDPPVRLWSGEGRLPLEDGTYDGIGNRALAQISGAAIGSAAAGITLTLSGIDPVVLDDLDADEVRDAPVVLRRLIFDSSGTQLLDAHVFDRGRADMLATDEEVGGEAAIIVTVEGAARGLGRRGGRMRTDADQRLIDPADGGFRKVSYAGEITLYWGGQKPTSASIAIGGGLAGVKFDPGRVARF